MRKIKVNTDTSSQSHIALVFFALTLDEQLYDLTDDSFKAPALNSFTRTLELQNVAQANHSAGISKDALKPFIEELSASIGQDSALTSRQKKLGKFHIDSINESLTEADRIARGASGLRIAMGDYFLSIIKSITDTILNKPNEKKKLLNLASSFIVQAETLGFPRRHTFHVTQNTLINRLKKNESLDLAQLLNEFFAHFMGIEVDYDCLFIGSNNFQKYPKLLEKFKIQIAKEKPQWNEITTDQKNFLESIEPNQFYITIEVKKRRSPAQAQKIAASIIEEFVGLVRFYEHKDDISTSKLALVKDKKTSKICRLHEAPDPMHCWVSHTSATENEMLEMGAVTHGDHLTIESAGRIRRTLRLHRSALLSNSAENQLIDLWAGLEGLVSRPGKESQRLEYFSDCLLPALTLSYPQKIFVSAYCDVSKIAPETKDLINTIPGEGSIFSKFVQLVLCPEHKAVQDCISALLATHPLLLNRVWRLSELFKSRAGTQQTLRHHRQKVRWHLSRIYHTRNSIMHTASALPYLPTLVENLHVYLDTLIKSIQKVASISTERQNIDGILQYLTTWEKYRLHALTSDATRNDSPLGNKEVWDVVFGSDMALTPSIQYEPLIS